MTLYQIEVRAIEEQHDVQAHRLAREILQLPTQHLPSLAAILNTNHSTNPPRSPFHMRTASLYRLLGNITPSSIDQLTQQLLVNPVIQEVHVTGYPARAHVVDVFFHPGVTDTLAQSVLEGAQMLGIPGLERVETGQRYILDERLSEADVRTIAQALLYNPVIQQYELHRGTEAGAAPIVSNGVVQDGEGAINCAPTKGVVGAQFIAPSTSIPLTIMIDDQLMELSMKGLLSLNLDEMRTIQQHYRRQGREPTDVELETLAQTWSEHCSHKTFKATIQYHEIDRDGNVLERETIPGLLKHYIMRATEQMRPEWLVSAFSDNAGMIRFTGQYDLAFKVETHNHPSAIEPFGGANTGVGGVIRDVLGVSAQPIACTDVLCFGPLDIASDALPVGVLPPRRIASGVVNGVRDYGNKMGIPTVNGAVLYHSGYICNPLVFCGCLGVLPHGSHPHHVRPGDRILVLGGRTGRDGVHGATFSSAEMSSEISAQAGTAVQIGAPITEKKVTDVILQARDRQLYSALTDCGAGGFSSAIGEMGAKTGARVELANAPLKYAGLAPWEIWLSEAQERMVLAVPPEYVNEVLEICAIEEVEASILGTFTDDHRLIVTYHGQTIADLDMAFLHDGRPDRVLEAVWQRNTPDGEVHFIAPETVWEEAPINTTHYAPTLLALLRHPTIASKEAIVRRYDHEVQGATILKPFVGRSGHGPGDAVVLQPLLDEQARAGVILSNGINPLYGKIDPYHMAINAVDEALRNLTAVGGDMTRAAILDNFCWGNPTDPAQLGMLVRAAKGCHDASIGFKVPFISGKDSLNNEYRSDGQRFPVIPTLLISAVGVLDDAAQTIDMPLKTPGNLLYQIGMTRNELAGSHYAEVVDAASFERLFSYTGLPQVHIARAATTMKALGEAIRKGLVRACHDLSEGGLAVAAAEMALAGMLGVTLDVHQIQPAGSPLIQDAVEIIRLFSESASRFLVEVTPEQWGAFEKHMRTRGVQDVIFVGTVTNTGQFIVRDADIELIHVSLEELQEAFLTDYLSSRTWKGGQR